MLSQRLRHRVAIKWLLVTTNTDTEGQEEDWMTLDDSVPAEVVPLSGREFIAAAANQAQVDTRITIRRRTDLKPSYRIEHEGNFYDIRAILLDPTLRRYMTLMCQSGVSGG